MQNDRVLQIIVGSLSVAIKNMAQLISGLTELETDQIITKAIAQCALTREALNEWMLSAVAEGIDPL